MSKLSTTGGQRVRLDATDLRLLELLRDDGRMSISALADRAHVSRATAYSRLEKMSAAGVLIGYTVNVDLARAGQDVTALVLLSARQAENTLRAKVEQFPEVEYFAFLTGPFDAIAIVRAANMATLRDVVLRKFQNLPEVRSSQTSIVLEEAIHLPFVLPARVDDLAES